MVKQDFICKIQLSIIGKGQLILTLIPYMRAHSMRPYSATTNLLSVLILIKITIHPIICVIEIKKLSYLLSLINK